MRKILFTIFPLFLFILNLQAQTSYIQVSGEPGLSVFLNGQFKGKTSADLGGYIIENVTPGQNTLKIVKEGYAPYEEVVTVKPGEVLAYNVKPFSKHKVVISEQGNSQSADEQVNIATGTLIIQSVPIEIRFTIKEIDGASDITKTKDQWKAESVPVGYYTIEFTYNSKKITKTVEIVANETSTVFANMLSGEITVKNTIDEKRAEQKLLNALRTTMDSLCQLYYFKINLTDAEFRKYNTAAASILPYGGGQRTNWKDKTPGPFYYSVYKDNGKVTWLVHILRGGVREDAAMYAYYKQQLEYYQRIVPSKYLVVSGNSFSFKDPETNLDIEYQYNPSGTAAYERYSYVKIRFYHRQ